MADATNGGRRVRGADAVRQLLLPPLSVAARSKRRPPLASDLLEALHDCVHTKVGRRIRSQPIRKPKVP